MFGHAAIDFIDGVASGFAAILPAFVCPQIDIQGIGSFFLETLAAPLFQRFSKFANLHFSEVRSLRKNLQAQNLTYF